MVEVTSPQIDCLFSPRCRINFLTTTDDIPINGAAGTASLITRTASITSHGLGAAKYLYEYVIDLSGAYGITFDPCIKSLSLRFGVPDKLDFDQNGIADEQVFIIARGNVGPSSAVTGNGSITFNFKTPVCVGQSSYPIGLVSSQAPHVVNAVLAESDGPTHMVQARAPIFSLFSGEPLHKKEAAPSNLPAPGNPPVQGCGTDPVSSPNLLDCWLQKNQELSWHIKWQLIDHNIINWPQWDATRKADLRKAFLDAWLWYQGGMTNFQGTPYEEPPTNMEPQETNNHCNTVLEPTQAWQRYLAEVAHSLAAEIGGWVPWSLKNYDYDSLEDLLSGWTRYHYDSDIEGDWYNVVYPGYLVYRHNVTPAHPVFIFSFLKQNNLVGSTRQETIAKVIDWARWNLQHMIGGYECPNYSNIWQYFGLPPVSRIIEGTVLSQGDEIGVFAHYTPACFGTTDFLRVVLRTVNIPAVHRMGDETCYHSMPYFPSEGLYLSHGDDPYTAQSKQTPVIPAEEFLIGQGVWDTWFTNASDPCANVGKRPVELLLQYLSTQLADKYCADMVAGSNHASGQVYQEFQDFYTVAELEAQTLWERLGQLAQNLGKCGP